MRLLREARAIARLSHPNVVAVHDAGTLGDRVFIAMEFVDGHTVEERLRPAPRTWQQILDVFVAAGRASRWRMPPVSSIAISSPRA